MKQNKPNERNPQTKSSKSHEKLKANQGNVLESRDKKFHTFQKMNFTFKSKCYLLNKVKKSDANYCATYSEPEQIEKNCFDLFRTLFFQNYYSFIFCCFLFCFHFSVFVEHCGHELFWMDVVGVLYIGYFGFGVSVVGEL